MRPVSTMTVLCFLLAPYACLRAEVAADCSIDQVTGWLILLGVQMLGAVARALVGLFTWLVLLPFAIVAGRNCSFGMQVLDAVAGALIGAFTWLNLGFIAPAVCWVYRKQAVVSLACSLLTLSLSRT